MPDLFFATGVDEKGRATGIAKLCATFTMDESTSIGLFDPNSAARAFSEAKCCELFFLGLLGALSLMLYFIALLAVHRGAFAASPIVYQEYSSAIYHLATRVLWIFLKKLVAFKLLEFGLCFGIEEGVDWQRFVEGGWATFLEAVGCCKVAGLGGNIGKGAVLAELVGTFGDRVELLVGLLTDQAEVLDVRLIEWFVHGRLFRMIIWFITPCILLEYQILKQS